MAITVPIISEWNKTQLDKATKDIESFGSKAGKAFNGLASAGKKLAIGLAGVGVAAVAVGKDLYEAGERAATSNARIDQIAQSMDLFGTATADVTDRLKKLADETARKTGIDQNQIKQAQATLLTFKSLAGTAGVVGSNFDRATQAAIDLAAAGFGSAETNAVQLGKALNDPIKGLSALARSGVTFTDAEKEVIETLVESGNTFKAQQLILEAIEKQVGGTAEATANSSDQMRVAFSQLQERVGLALLPVFNKLANFFIDTLFPALERAYNYVIPKLSDAWVALQENLGPLIKQLRDFLEPIIDRIVTFLKENTEVVKVFMAVLAGAAAIAMIASLAAAFAALFNPVTLIIVAIAAVAAGIAYAWNNFETFRNIVKTVVDVIVGYFEFWWASLKWVFDNIFGGFDGIVGIWNFLVDAIKVGVDVIKWYVNTIWDVFKTVFNAIASGWNNTVGKLSFDVPSWVPLIGGKGFSVPKIPKLADGGIVTGPTLAIIGEAGPEAVVPLDRAGGMGGMNVTINMPAGSDGDDVLRALERAGRRRGGLPLRTAAGIKL